MATSRIDANVLLRKLNEPAFKAQLNQNPEDAVRSIAEHALRTDKWVYRFVVWALGLTVLLTVVGAIYLAAPRGQSETAPIPDILVAIGSAAVGALAGLLAPPPDSSAG